jgi:hypothetical protein
LGGIALIAMALKARSIEPAVPAAL